MIPLLIAGLFTVLALPPASADDAGSDDADASATALHLGLRVGAHQFCVGAMPKNDNSSCTGVYYDEGNVCVGIYHADHCDGVRYPPRR